ncbi:unnamed protein product [Blepharisma stoltei]|uniref:Uncharacterized protein n=1 Tax=Blepharisma stoltei TaxID=1481888 RepID=A0AAU9IDS1_9CILI|nr:unnamed protein product [Blepharisma stoltei]
MSKDAIHEIDGIIRRTNKIYLGYLFFNLSSFYLLGSFWKTGLLKKSLVLVPTSLFFSGIFTWIHIEKTYKKEEKVFLLVGLDEKYDKIKKDNS